MATIGLPDDFQLHGGEIYSAELKVFDNLERRDHNNTQFSFLDFTQPAQSRSSPDNIEISSFPVEKSAGEEVCQNFESCESRDSDSQSTTTFKRLRTDDDEDGILEFQWKRKKNAKEKSSQAQKIIIEVESEEVLEDGYKWQKYGEKSMENSRMPRFYYKCSDKKCNVKKREERKALENEVLVITYEGIHNHQCPNPVYYVHVEKRIYIPMPDSSNNY